MSLQTRAQKDMLQAEELVNAVAQKPKELKDSYGRLCHQFPVLVRTCGLCQALAFSAAKTQAEGARGQAHQLLLSHVGEVLGLPTEANALVETVAKASATEYMFYTRRVLSAWVYFKQFAVSILDVPGPEDERGGNL